MPATKPYSTKDYVSYFDNVEAWRIKQARHNSNNIELNILTSKPGKNFTYRIPFADFVCVEPHGTTLFIYPELEKWKQVYPVEETEKFIGNSYNPDPGTKA